MRPLGIVHAGQVHALFRLNLPGMHDLLFSGAVQCSAPPLLGALERRSLVRQCGLARLFDGRELFLHADSAQGGFGCAGLLYYCASAITRAGGLSAGAGVSIGSVGLPVERR